MQKHAGAFWERLKSGFWLKRRSEKAIVGVTHEGFIPKNREEFLQAAGKNIRVRKSAETVIKKLDGLASRKGNGNIMIEHPGSEGEYGFFRYVTEEARKRNLEVTYYNPDKPAQRRNMGYFQAVVGMGLPIGVQKKLREKAVKEYRMPELKEMPYEEILRRQVTLWENMTNFLIKGALSHKPDLIVAGAGHIPGALQWIGKYKNETPKEIAKDVKISDRELAKMLGRRKMKELNAKMLEHRKRIVERFKKANGS